MKKIFVIYCNPKGENSFSYKIAETYSKSAKKAGNEARVLNVYDLRINYLEFSNDEEYLKITGSDRGKYLSGELKHAQDNILWADELVFVYPVWWGGIPAKLKSFIEVVFQPGVVASITPENPKPVPLLTNKTAVIIQTYFMPVFVMKNLTGDIIFKSLYIGVLKTCGIKVKKRFDLGLAGITEEKIEKWLKGIEKFAGK